MKKQCSNCIHWQGDEWRKAAECVVLSGGCDGVKSKIKVLEFPGGVEVEKTFGNLAIDTEYDFYCSHWEGYLNE